MKKKSIIIGAVGVAIVVLIIIIAVSVSGGGGGNCNRGYFIDGKVCTACPVGYGCNGKEKQLCASGSEPNKPTLATQCSPCIGGYYKAVVDEANNFCLKCPMGKYTHLTGQTTCLACA